MRGVQVSSDIQALGLQSLVEPICHGNCPFPTRIVCYVKYLYRKEHKILSGVSVAVYIRSVNHGNASTQNFRPLDANTRRNTSANEKP